MEHLHTQPGVLTIQTASCAAANASGPLAFSRLTAGGRVFHFAELRSSLRQQQSRKWEEKIVGQGQELAAACYLLPERDAGFPDFNTEWALPFLSG